ncbi:MAG: holo-ACP synthase [Ignavibacteriaceae bacterium]|nr:holo-ACP synthase [Ignavibacteriaceae bacterium]
MIAGNGIDIIEVNRIKKSIDDLGDAFLNKIFTPLEIKYCEGKSNKYESYSARFAAKEAVYKAVYNAGIILSWLDIEVLPTERGEPVISKLPKIAELYNQGYIIHLSLTHSHNFAVCSAILEQTGQNLPQK